MVDYTNIELKPGETLADALVRLSKTQMEQPTGTTKNIGKVKNALTVADSAKKGNRSGKTKKAAAKDLGGDPQEGVATVDPNIYSALHIYQRPGETEGKMRSNARHEREMHGPNCLVFAHSHQFGEKCHSGCTAAVGEGE